MKITSDKTRIRRQTRYLVLLTLAAAVIFGQRTAASQTAQWRHWAYTPVTSPALPQVQDAAWVRTPIDAFILARLEEAGIAPSPEADRAAFIRRATLDAWGLIPTPEEVQAFVSDESPDAYEKLVERLLASPRYAERQARRWLDLSRYADTSGFENDRVRANLWRYRDYVIRAFDEDKPYDQFVREQLAGDELYPGNQEAAIATGFLGNYPDNDNSRDMVARKYEITTDMTDTVGAVFLAQTLDCARCHNHKFDDISQKEYFQLQAFFANTTEIRNVPAEAGPRELEIRAAQAAWEEATAELRAARSALVDVVRDQAIQYQKERYLTDTREAVFKPESEWTALDRWINHRWENVTAGSDYGVATYLEESAELEFAETGVQNEEKLALLAEYRRLGQELNKFNNLRPRAGLDTYFTMAELDAPDVTPTYLLFSGNHDIPLEEVQPGFPAAIGGPQPVFGEGSEGRRSALADWIASPENPLTARVFVNRIWSQYFGRGIVETVSDFGLVGAQPTHPELLDWLADEFVANGWSIKNVHRQILLSSVYRQSSDSRADASRIDPENRLLALFPRQRLEAEQIRDSLLAASGKLVDRIGGPSVFPPIPTGLNAGNQWQVSEDSDDHNRRSLYVFTRRSLPYPMLDVFDMASSQQVHSRRDVTTTPLQALTLYNDAQVFEWARALAGRVIRETGGDESAQLDLLYRILFARSPDASEQAIVLAFLDGHQQVIRENASNGRLSITLPEGLGDARTPNPLREAALVDLVHVLMNSNDFVYRY